MNPRNFCVTYDVKFLKSRYKRFAGSYRSMNPRNFCVTYDVKFRQSRTRSVFLHPSSFRPEETEKQCPHEFIGDGMSPAR